MSNHSDKPDQVTSLTLPIRALRANFGAALLVALTLAVFWRATGSDFLPYDDPVYITKNPHVLAGLSAEGLRWSLTATAGGNWHPLTWWSHMLDVQLFGVKPGGHHATSVILHAAAAAALFWSLAAMTGALWPSFVTAALFALHPLHVESVAWVSERKDVLAACCWMLAMRAYRGYARRPRRRGYLLVLAIFTLALMSKPMAVTLPLVFLLLDFWPLNRFPRPLSVRGAARLIGEKVPFLLLAAAAGVVAVRSQQAVGALDTLVEVPAPFRAAMQGLRLLNASLSFAGYLVQTLWPVELSVFYPYPAHALSPWRSAAAALGVVAITVAVIRFRRRAPHLATGWFWYLVTLLPVIGLLQVGAQAHADRYTYLPLVGVFLMASWAGRDLAQRRPAPRMAIGVAAAAVLAACAGAAFRQIGYWRDGSTLFGRALEVTTGNYVAHRLLGLTMNAKGDFVAAERHFRAEVALSPGSSSAHNRLAMTLGDQKRIEEAVAEFRKAVLLDPDSHEAHNNLGVYLTSMNRLQEAEAHLRSALRLSPGTAEIHVNLGDNQARQGKVRDAELRYREALKLRPGMVQALRRLERLSAAPGGR